jgi:hypothetical protein
MSTETLKRDAWEALQGELEKVSAFRGAHPELFNHDASVCFHFFPGLERPHVGLHVDRDLLYDFARKHQEAGWVKNDLGNWNGIYQGIAITLFSMETKVNIGPVTFPLTNEEADDAAGFPKAAVNAPMTPEQRAVDFVKDPSIEKAAAIMYGDKGVHPDLAKAMEIVARAPGTNPNPNPTFI